MIVVGGSGGGRRDRSIRALARRGRVLFHGVGLAPGETAGFGKVGERPVLIVPGRLDAALAVWVTLGRCLVARLAGCKANEPSEAVVLARKVASALGFVEVVPVVRNGNEITPLASSYLGARALANADGYIVIPADSEGFAAGASVPLRALP